MHRIDINVLAGQKVLQVRSQFIQAEFDFDLDQFGDFTGGIIDQNGRCAGQLPT